MFDVNFIRMLLHRSNKIQIIIKSGIKWQLVKNKNISIIINKFGEFESGTYKIIKMLVVVVNSIDKFWIRYSQNLCSILFKNPWERFKDFCSITSNKNCI